MKKISYALLGLLFVACASHDKQNNHFYSKLTPHQLKKDVEYVQKQLTNMHPDLYWYISKEALNSKFDSLKNTLEEPLTPNEFFLKISPIVASVRQGHMGISMVQLTSADSVKKKYKNSLNPIDNFEYEYLNNKLFVKRNKLKNDTLIQKGTQVLSINGITPNYLFEKYGKTFTSDGYNKTAVPKFFARRVNSFYQNELGFVDSINMEVVCADSVFHHTVKRIFKEKKAKKKEVNQTKKDTLTNQSIAKNDTLQKRTKEEEKARKLALKEASKKTFYKHRWFGYDSETKTYSKQISYPVAQDSTIAVLTIKDFIKGKTKVYDTIFSELNKHNVQDLIIDLRGNPGGRLNEIHQLSQYLNDTTFVFTQPATITKRTTFFNIFKGKSVTSKILGAPFLSVFSTIRGIKAQRTAEGELRLKLKSSKITEPKPLNYKNNLYVITDGMTFSAAAIISSHLKGRERAFFVGDETGGTFNGTVAGIMPVVKLPHSKLKLRVGLMTIKPNEQTQTEGYGVMPDVYIKPTEEDFMNDKDTALEYLLNKIETNKKGS
ncbi:S41 family peptidase [Flavobacterium sp. CBA20B-1]|uniref:S41 family peptidase n=1 Tax=unclassified Flavobacterium TaxID=196869 RepID=UPI002224A89F|nr:MULTISPECIES: S41 family peptidase [unclassified Flavobacterium]WCM42653.1 S41 family peptidase [Flavobacterium sp. CBA20B-1]